MAEQEFFSFEEALDELRLKEEELKRLVSEGEIRAFREGETMRLRRTDVETLRSELSGGEVVDLGDSNEELVFEDDLELDAPGMATEEIADMDTLLDDDIEDVGEIAPRVASGGAAVAAAASVTAPRRSAAVVSEVDEQEEGMGWRIVMIATSALLFFGLPIAISASTGNASGIAKSMANIFGSLVGADPIE